MGKGPLTAPVSEAANLLSGLANVRSSGGPTPAKRVPRKPYTESGFCNTAKQLGVLACCSIEQRSVG